MSKVEKIVDLIFQEALARKGSLDIPGRVCEVRVEAMLLVVEALAGVREAERREKNLDK